MDWFRPQPHQANFETAGQQKLICLSVRGNGAEDLENISVEALRKNTDTIETSCCNGCRRWSEPNIQVLTSDDI